MNRKGLEKLAANADRGFAVGRALRVLNLMRSMPADEARRSVDLGDEKGKESERRVAEVFVGMGMRILPVTKPDDYLRKIDLRAQILSSSGCWGGGMTFEVQVKSNPDRVREELDKMGKQYGEGDGQRLMKRLSRNKRIIIDGGIRREGDEDEARERIKMQTRMWLEAGGWGLDYLVG